MLAFEASIIRRNYFCSCEEWGLTYKMRACCYAGILYLSARGIGPIEKLFIKISKKMNNESPAWTAADSITNNEDLQVSQYSSKMLC